MTKYDILILMSHINSGKKHFIRTNVKNRTGVRHIKNYLYW